MCRACHGKDGLLQIVFPGQSNLIFKDKTKTPLGKIWTLSEDLVHLPEIPKGNNVDPWNIFHLPN